MLQQRTTKEIEREQTTKDTHTVKQYKLNGCIFLAALDGKKLNEIMFSDTEMAT